MTRKRGAARPCGDQKWRTPARDSAIIDSNPDASSSTKSAERTGAIADAAACASTGASSAVSIANLARKPESGGSPATISAQAMKLRPRNAVAAGIASPVSGSSSPSSAPDARVSR